jgi:hypothetical protein
VPHRDWNAWHEQYDDPSAGLAQRLEIVQRRLAEVLRAAPDGPVRLLSMCAGGGRDVIGVLRAHPRRTDVSALLVELDPAIAGRARRAAADAGLQGVEVIEADAALSDVYAKHVPAQVVLACGIFGNVPDADVERTARSISMLCAEGASVIWTRHRREPDLTPRIRSWFTASGFEELSFHALANETLSGVGTFRLRSAPLPYEPGFRFFRFVR